MNKNLKTAITKIVNERDFRIAHGNKSEDHIVSRCWAVALCFALDTLVTHKVIPHAWTEKEANDGNP
jgi:hypothetical protein